MANSLGPFGKTFTFFDHVDAPFDDTLRLRQVSHTQNNSNGLSIHYRPIKLKSFPDRFRSGEHYGSVPVDVGFPMGVVDACRYSGCASDSDV